MTKTKNANAVIIGGGVMGASILYNLVSRGVGSAVLLERSTLGAGSTGRSSGAVRMHYSTTVNAHLAWESLKIFQNWGDAVGGEGDCGFVRTGYMVFVPQEAIGGFERNIELQQELGIDTRIVSKEEARGLAPVFQYDEGESYAWEPQSGHADPSGTGMAYAARAREMGAQVILESPVTDIEIEKGKVTAVRTAAESYQTPLAVIATGPWSGPFMRRLGYDLPLDATRHEVFLIRRPVHEIPHHPGGADMTNLTYFRPEGSDLTLVGNGNAEDIADPDDYSPAIHADHLEDVWLRLAHRIPAIADGELFTGYAGLYTSTPDLHPIIDQVNGIDGLYLCTGFSGHGFKLAPAVGVCMAQMILDGTSKLVDLTPLRMSRFAEGSLNTTTYEFKVIA